MKKHLFVMALVLLMAKVVYGQTPRWNYSYGDTIDIMGSLPGFYIDGWWPDTVWRDTNGALTSLDLMAASTCLRYNHTDQTLRITGIAVGEIMNPCMDTADGLEYVYLYDAHPDSLETKARIALNVDTPHWYAKVEVFPFIDGVTMCILPGKYYEYFPLYKYYFDSAITVSDSFYVGISSSMCLTDTNESIETYMYDHMMGTYMGHDIPLSRCRFTHLQQYRIELNGQVRYLLEPYHAMVFPLIDEPLPPPCPRVGTVRAFVEDGNRVRLSWVWGVDSLHAGWEVAYGRSGMPPDSCITVQCNSASTVIDDLVVGVRYVAYVRARCNHWTGDYYSEWSDSVEMYIPNRYNVTAEANYEVRGVVEGGGVYEEGDVATLTARAWMPYVFYSWDDGDVDNPRRVVVTQDTAITALFTDPVGIATADSGLVGMQPNPASGKVAVMSSYGIERVEVYDARGVRVYEQAASGTATGFDVSGWAKGAYAVMIYTPAGVATRRLVVK